MATSDDWNRRHDMAIIVEIPILVETNPAAANLSPSAPQGIYQNARVSKVCILNFVFIWKKILCLISNKGQSSKLFACKTKYDQEKQPNKNVHEQKRD
jgi:hypothetical protein